MTYTKEEKERIIRQFKLESENNLHNLKETSERMANSAELQVQRQLNKVSVTLWNVKIKDVLQIERHHKPTVRSLLRDVKDLHEDARTYSDSSLLYSILKNQSDIVYSNEQKPTKRIVSESALNSRRTESRSSRGRVLKN